MTFWGSVVVVGRADGPLGRRSAIPSTPRWRPWSRAATQEQRRHGRLIVRRGPGGAAPPERQHVSKIEQVVGLGGRANRGGIREGSGWALLW
jgi:hypothetical protein